MSDYFKQIGSCIYKISVVLLLFTISRIFFYIFNYQSFSHNTFWEILKIFTVGIRFDFSAIIYVNLLLVLLYILPFKFAIKKGYLKSLNIVFVIINAFLLLLNFVDIEYFKYIGRRSTADLFGYIFLSDDVAKLMPQFLHDFWYLAILWVVSIVFMVYLLKYKPFIIEYIEPKAKFLPVIKLLIAFLVIGLLFTGARGLNLKPVRIITAARYTESRNLPLLLNTPFCIIQTVSEKDIATVFYYPQEQLEKIYSPVHQFNAKDAKMDNVVVIILESFSYDFIGSLTGNKGYTPNLDSIASKGLTFVNAFANGKRSIDAVPAILAGLPALTDDAYIGSRYSGNALDGLPQILDQLGYNTSFFHGGRNGTMGFDEFSRIAGISKYYGLNEYQGPEAYDGHWGIYDEDFYRFFIKKLNSYKPPFFSTIFTLSSHHPYSVPKKYEHLFPDTEKDLFRALRYSDYALGKFFNEAAKMPWFKNTMFVLLADHTARDESNAEDISLGMYRIPIIFYHPGDSLLKGRPEKIVQQTDIMPSVLDYLGYKKPFVSFGNSVFSDTDSFAVYYLSGIYKFIRQGYLLTFDGEKSLSLYSITSKFRKTDDVLKMHPEIALSMENELKGIIQQYYTRLKENSLVIK